MTEQNKTIKVGKIYQKISLIMAAVGAIGKDQENVSQHFSYRGIDDVYNALNRHMAEHRVFTVSDVLREDSEERPSKSGGILITRIYKIKYKFYAEDGSFVETTVMGEAMDTGDKASNKAFAVAHKYALLQIFCIPTDEVKDPDAESHEAVSKKAEKKERPKQKKNGAKREPIPVKMNIDGSWVELDYYDVLQRFTLAKESLGDKDYYEILGSFGYEKSNLIPKDKMNEIYQSLVQRYKDIGDDRRLKPSPSAAPEPKDESQDEQDEFPF